jgi:hypothetical protein
MSKTFITKWTWQEEEFKSKDWRSMIISQKMNGKGDNVIIGC